MVLMLRQTETITGGETEVLRVKVVCQVARQRRREPKPPDSKAAAVSRTSNCVSDKGPLELGFLGLVGVCQRVRGAGTGQRVPRPGGEKSEGLFRGQHVGEWGWFQAGSGKLQEKHVLTGTVPQEEGGTG